MRAEGEGFKPPVPIKSTPDFESSAIDHSANLPYYCVQRYEISVSCPSDWGEKLGFGAVWGRIWQMGSKAEAVCGVGEWALPVDGEIQVRR